MPDHDAHVWAFYNSNLWMIMPQYMIDMVLGA